MHDSFQVAQLVEDLDAVIVPIARVDELALSSCDAPDGWGTLDGSPNGGRVFIVDHETGAILAQVGGPGEEPGKFMAAHGISIDSKENIYVAETTPGNHVQRFLRASD